MSAHEADELQQIPLDSDAAVQERVELLIGVACRRQWWMLLLDDAGRQLPIIIPMADYPTTPNGGAAEALAERIGDTVVLSGAAQVVFVWERPGGRRLTHLDLSWARALGASCAAAGIAVRAQLISHDRGVRWVAPDDLL
ncbi:hypothetical protein [Microterricola viridarii]|uniref:Uncharacterized protein n=1 Tax=Microterricola viridarii TaxID=412690 RepID=A0A1H1Y1X5_9MICO|nr:hypothetical protein [Microterricola viridarii]SDT15415.1 hypothetical protein SAMN04489834_2952 [Microterricola viridarii]